MIGRLVTGCLCLAVTAGSSGCRATSRWAMDDPEYAEKYSRPYVEQGLPKYGRMAKQLADARFLDGKTGVTVEGLANADPTMVGASASLLHYSRPWFSQRVGLAGAVSAEHQPGFLVGLDGGVRFNVPSRISPFVGVGAFGGIVQREVTVGNGRKPELEEYVEEAEAFAHPDRERDAGGMLAVYPEAGATFWINGHSAVQGFGRYYVSTDGRDNDSWMMGIGLTFMLGPRSDEVSRTVPGPTEGGFAAPPAHPSPASAIDDGIGAGRYDGPLDAPEGEANEAGDGPRLD